MGSEIGIRIGRLVLGVVIGGLSGFGYGWLVACAGGTCPLAGKPVISAIWGSAAGALIAWR